MQPHSAVLSAIARATGTGAASWNQVVAGHTRAQKWLVALADGRRAFVKAATETVARNQIDREALVIESIAADFMPRLYGTSAEGEWSVLVLEDLSSASWGPPYPDGGAALLGALAGVASTRPPDGLPRRPIGRQFGTYWSRIAASPERVLALGRFSSTWLETALPLLDAAESVAQLSGDSLLHDDVWAGNVCHVERGAILIDWASATIGDHRVDLACALLSIRSSHTTPPAVDFPDEPAYAALFAGANAFAASQPDDPGIPDHARLRRRWLEDLDCALDWAGELLGLAARR